MPHPPRWVPSPMSDSLHLSKTIENQQHSGCDAFKHPYQLTVLRALYQAWLHNSKTLTKLTIPHYSICTRCYLEHPSLVADIERERRKLHHFEQRETNIEQHYRLAKRRQSPLPGRVSATSIDGRHQRGFGANVSTSTISFYYHTPGGSGAHQQEYKKGESITL